MNFYEKYLKYKNKYLLFKSNLKGGDIPIILKPERVNLFDELYINYYNVLNDKKEVLKMVKFLNPIHGFILYHNGYIYNNYYLNNIDENDYKLIKNMIKEIPGLLQPNNHLMEIKPKEYGNYLAIKYVFYFYNLDSKNKIISKPTINQIEYFFNKTKLNTDDNNFINNINRKFNNFITLNDNNLFSFYILLYCLFWVSDDDNGIKEYYEGINEFFKIFNKYNNNKFKLIDINRNIDNSVNLFEKNIINMFKKDFIIFNQQQSLNFCNENSTYADCVETTMRNLINLICLNDNKFDIDILINLGAITQLITYYETFNNFNEQSNLQLKKNI